MYCVLLTFIYIYVYLFADARPLPSKEDHADDDKKYRKSSLKLKTDDEEMIDSDSARYRRLPTVAETPITASYKSGIHDRSMTTTINTLEPL
jgi:hypothetical protein